MNTMNTKSLIFNTDSYKIGHWMLQPEGEEYQFSYVESRGGFKPFTMFAGILPYIKKHLLTPVTMQDIKQAEVLMNAHLGPGIFNRKGWERLVEKHGGLMPVEIRAMKEGTVTPIQVPLVTLVNTDPEFAWVTSYLETSLLRDIWYATTIATISYHIRQTLTTALLKTADSLDGLEFMLHDFGYRGVSSDESAGAGGAAHLFSFDGTDNIAALIYNIEYYNATGASAFSVIASEHSVTCANSDPVTKDDKAMVEKMVGILEDRVRQTGEFAIVSVVADTYDVFRLAKEYVGGVFKDRIMNSGGRLVVRPDSGDPVKIPVQIAEILLEQFGYETNSKGYKVLPSCIRVLQGDGINEDSITQIAELAESKGISVENFVFGSGGALLQHADRDWLKFAMKSSAVRVNGEWKDIFKDPITDPGKLSKKGRITTVKTCQGEIECKRIEDVLPTDVDLLETVYLNGKLIRDEHLDDIRKRARSY